MSDDSYAENATDPQDTAGPTSASASGSVSGEQTHRRGRLRQIILFCLLGLMLLALAYDYRIARPNVERAFDQIVKLNDEMNINAKPTPTLNSDIHKEIGRDPARVFTEGPYRIEVFSWTAGLPFRTHDLFAVYIPNGDDLIFMRHYKFALPDNELDPPRPESTGNDGEAQAGAAAMPAPPVGMGMEGGGGGRGRGGPGGPGPGGDGEGGDRPQRPSGEGQDENPGAVEGSPTTPDAEGATPAANTAPSEAASGTPEPSAPEVDGEAAN